MVKKSLASIEAIKEEESEHEPTPSDRLQLNRLTSLDHKSPMGITNKSGQKESDEYSAASPGSSRMQRSPTLKGSILRKPTPIKNRDESETGLSVARSKSVSPTKRKTSLDEFESALANSQDKDETISKN